MGEQLPLQTLNRFVKCALPRDKNGLRTYYSRPERITDSYEARRHLAPRVPFHGDPPVHGQTEFFEYHWSYLMTGNKLADMLPTLRRILVRRPGTVPYGLTRLWWIVWAVLVVVLALVVWAVAALGAEGNLSGVLTVLLGSGALAGLVLYVLRQAGNAVTRSFVDVVRYLDRSPRSYEARRAIRKGMVDLLQALHDRRRYSRIIVVAHSLGAYIAYDAITYLWPEMSKLHAGPPANGVTLPLTGLDRLEAMATQVAGHPVKNLTGTQRSELDEFRENQFELWKSLREQGNPWLITDLITVGTPMYFADLLYTHNRNEFKELVKRSELAVCPPVDQAQTVEGRDRPTRHYGWVNQGRTVLHHGAPFAVVRWTNLFFPAENHWHGDWFGGPLRPLFGTGIVDHPITGDLPHRRAPGLAHSRYFSYPDATGPEDAAPVLRGYLKLDLEGPLAGLATVPAFDATTDTTP
jgi:hypothetical protein